MRRWRTPAILLALIVFLSLPCRRHAGIKGLDLSVTFSEKALTDNLFTDVTYHFRTASAFTGLPQPLEVVAEFWDRNSLLVQESFMPDVPTPAWTPGKDYAFTRRLYIPSFLDEFSPDYRGYGTLRLLAGLRSPSDQSGGSWTVLLNRRLRVTPAPTFPVIVYLSGWYEPEGRRGVRPGRWRWTSREAKCIIDNPGHDGLLVIRGSVDTAAPAGQTITIEADGRTLDSFTPGPGEFDRSYTVREAWLDGRKDFVLTIGVDKTFVPAKVVPGSKDERELGVRITLLYFR